MLRDAPVHWQAPGVVNPPVERYGGGLPDRDPHRPPTVSEILHDAVRRVPGQYLVRIALLGLENRSDECVHVSQRYQPFIFGAAILSCPVSTCAARDRDYAYEGVQAMKPDVTGKLQRVSSVGHITSRLRRRLRPPRIPSRAFYPEIKDGTPARHCGLGPAPAAQEAEIPLVLKSLAAVAYLGQRLAIQFYRTAAWSSARMLATSPIVESILAHRSVGTGEVVFGRSDIDLLVVIRQACAHDGQALADFYRTVRICRFLNPALGHMEVHDPEGLQSSLATDTSLGSVERRSCLLMYGRPVPMEDRPVCPSHAVCRFSFGIQTLLSPALHQRSRRYLRKAVLDSWSQYATACGLIKEPCLTRDEAERRLQEAGECANPDATYGESPRAAAYVFDLAARLHHRLLPELGTLSRPVVFVALLPPRYTLRTFVILPNPGSLDVARSLPSNVFLCTPQALDLFLHYTNAFLYWNLPRELLEIGMRPPSIAEFRRSCRFYTMGYFLRIPGFLNEVPYMPVTTTASVAHALRWLSQGEIPPPIPEERIREATAAAGSCGDYYRKSYHRTYRENEEIQRSLAAVSAHSPAPAP